MNLDPHKISGGEQYDYLALQAEFQDLHNDVLRSNELERRIRQGEILNAEETAFLASMPDKMRRACDITRILRRTNTGPAKVKAPRKGKVKMTQEDIDKLIDC